VCSISWSSYQCIRSSFDLTVETPSGFTLTFTIYDLYPIPKSRRQFRLSRLVGLPGSAGVARSLISWLGFCVEALVVYSSSFIDRTDLRSELIALLEIYQ